MFDVGSWIPKQPGVLPSPRLRAASFAESVVDGGQRSGYGRFRAQNQNT